ncbi:MAG: phosphatase [Opitutaceae bacterium]
MSSGPVAVVDIGSNSIKVLVATRDASGLVIALHSRTIDARIGAGISQLEPRLTEGGMAAGLAAIRSLLDDAARYSPARVALVATSAVRDASNGADFRARVRAATGHEIRILSGHEEANLIGRGLTSDPALRDLRDFYVFDLGGGSLECLTFRDRRIVQAVSLQLGCVRLTEKFVANPAQPFPAAATDRIAAHVRESAAAAGFKFSLARDALVIGTGGTMATARAILAARDGLPFDGTEPTVTVAQLRELFATLGALPLTARKQIAGLPPARADVFPTALATFIALAEIGGIAAFRNSLFNLRYGLAAELLAAASAQDLNGAQP